MILIRSLENMSLGGKVVIAIFISILLYMMVHYTLKLIEMGYVMRHKKPLYNNFYFFLRKLSKPQKQILQKQFSFYNKLQEKQKKYFEHRVASFIKDKEFIGRQDLKITEEMKVLISATAVMLTFGFRDFYIGLIDKIFIYPKAFYSKLNDSYHKGEFNPKLKALVLSWEDFEHGFSIDNDNLNLGIHELAHAIHFNSKKERDVSSVIFTDSFKELVNMLSNDETLRENLIKTRYFREYGYTNQYEFLAVIIETFFETPKEFKSKFPEIYKKTKQMLNFNFAGY